MYAVYKRGNFADWAQYVEIFGQPIRIMKYDAYDTQTKTELNKVLNSSGSSLAMMIPKQADFEMMDGKASNGDGKLQNGFKDACNAEMAICILGNTETTTSSTSSGYAQSKEHGKQQDEITKADLTFVANMLNHERFTNVLKSYGFAVEGGKFEYELELDLMALKTRMEIDTFISAKVPIGDDYWYETYGIPKPENYEALKKEIQAQAQNQAQSQAKNQTKNQEPIANSPKLKDPKKQNLIDGFLKNLADFFDQAQP
jgi:phage gp29-like protein